MKNLFKKVLCTAIVATQVMTGFTSVKAAEDLLLMDANFDNLAIGAKEALASGDFTHTVYDYDNNGSGNKEINQIAKDTITGSGVSTAIEEAGYGKEGNAFVYNMVPTPSGVFTSLLSFGILG